jgi:nitrogen fixation NifU-like protein
MEAAKPLTVVGMQGRPGEGAHMIIVLKVLDGRILQARYSTYGCTVAEVCGQWVCDQTEGKPLADAGDIDEAALVAGVGQMPLGREHCTGLTINALKNALAELETRISGDALSDEVTNDPGDAGIPELAETGSVARSRVEMSRRSVLTAIIAAVAAFALMACGHSKAVAGSGDPNYSHGDPIPVSPTPPPTQPPSCSIS